MRRHWRQRLPPLPGRDPAELQALKEKAEFLMGVYDSAPPSVRQKARELDDVEFGHWWNRQRDWIFWDGKFLPRPGDEL